MNKLCLLLLLVIGSLVSSCSSSDLEYENDFEKSYEAWVDFKKASNNSYRYMITGTSWIGIRTETVITVHSGKIVERSFKVFQRSGPNATDLEILEQWTEDESQLNTHPIGGLYTLDEVYEKARTEWLKKRENAQVYFEAKNDGMISSCGYTENGCVDDCFIGIRIEFIEKVNL